MSTSNRRPSNHFRLCTHSAVSRAARPIAALLCPELLESRRLLSSVAGTVFWDANDNALRDQEESVLSTRTVFYDTNFNGSLDAGEVSGVSDSTGAYYLQNLPDSTCGNVRVVTEAGWRLSAPTDWGQFIDTYTPTDYTGKDLGITDRGRVTGTLFNDADDDGIKDSGEGGLANWTVWIESDWNGILDAGERTEVTDGSGYYRFNNLAANTSYAVRAVPQSGWRMTTPESGYQYVSFWEDLLQTGKDFGLTDRGKVTGTLFNDADDDGIKDSGEGGLASWTVWADSNWNSIPDTGERSDVTDSSGFYELNNITPTCHNIRAVPQSGWRMTTPTNGYHFVYLSAGDLQTGKDFGVTQRGRISGSVFSDANFDGVRNGPDLGRPNQVVYLDADDDAVLDPDELQTTTDVDGKYSIGNLSTGMTYNARVVPHSAWAAYEPIGNLLNVTLASSGAHGSASFSQVRALPAPMNLAATRVSSTRIDLSWSDVSGGETGFRVEASLNGGAYSQIAQIGADSQSYSATNLQSDGNYRFRVAAYDANGNSYYSKTANADAPAAPTNFQSRVTSTDVELTWGAVSGAAKYYLFKSTSPDTPPSYVYATVTGTTYTLTAAANGPVAYWIIWAVGSGTGAAAPSSGDGPQIRVVPPTTAGTMVISAPFAQPSYALATRDPTDAHPYSVENYIKSSVGVSKFKPEWGTLTGASAELDWRLMVTTEFSGTENLNMVVSAKVGYANETPDSVPDAEVGSVVVGIPQAIWGAPIHNRAGSLDDITLDNPASGYGVNEIEVWTNASAYVSSPEDGEASISGFFVGFYSVTYQFTTP